MVAHMLMTKLVTVQLEVCEGAIPFPPLLTTALTGVILSQLNTHLRLRRGVVDLKTLCVIEEDKIDPGTWGECSR